MKIFILVSHTKSCSASIVSTNSLLAIGLWNICLQCNFLDANWLDFLMLHFSIDRMRGQRRRRLNVQHPILQNQYIYQRGRPDIAGPISPNLPKKTYAISRFYPKYSQCQYLGMCQYRRKCPISPNLF
jgi:hypothetical protein